MGKLMEFLTAVCGFHYYKKYWDPVESECLDCADEKENPYEVPKRWKDCCHLPLEISRPTKYLLDRGARIATTLTSTLHYASPIVQGGLEIPCLTKVYMPRTVKNRSSRSTGK